MKYVLVIALVFVAFWFWRNGRRQERAEAARKPAPARAVAAPQAMTRCAQCGLHLPEADAIAGPGGWYCGTEHRAQAGR